MTVLRADVLGGTSAALAGGPADALAAALEHLGARVVVLPEPLGLEGDRLGEWAAANGPLDALVCDAGPGFGAGEAPGLHGALDAAWACVRELATYLISSERPGKLLLVTPRADAGPLAGAARAGLENLARTLSVEWARYGITACAILPGTATTDEELSELVAYLLSPAGDYFSGCRLELGTQL